MSNDFTNEDFNSMLKEMEDEKARVPGISLEEYNRRYAPTETLNRILKSNN